MWNEALTANSDEAMLAEQVQKPRKLPRLSYVQSPKSWSRANYTREPQPLVTIHIQPPEGTAKSFSIHKTFLCYYSDYFEAALNSGYRECEPQELVLEGVHIEVFGLFVNWIYKQVLVYDTSYWPSYFILMELGLFADRIQAPRLRNLAQVYLDRARKQLPDKRFQRVYDNCCDNSFPRRYILDTWNPKYSIKTGDRDPHQFVFDLNETRSKGMDLSGDIIMEGAGTRNLAKRKMMEDTDTNNTTCEQQSSPCRSVKRMRTRTQACC